MTTRFAWGLLLVLAAAACSSSSSDEQQPPPVTPPKPRHEPAVLPPLGDVFTTVDRTLVPKTPRSSAPTGPNPADPVALADYLGRGFGELDVGPGEPYVTRVIDNSAPPPPGPNAQRILRFVHTADFQLADDESPTRLAMFDTAAATSSAARPQDAYLARMANAAVRTINALHRKDPIAFTLLGGDNADSAQTNEVDWILAILSGADDVEADSGEDDEIEEGPGNDGKDPFKAEGLAMPWKWVTGNHDILVQGNLRVSESIERVLSSSANGGTRNYKDGSKGVIERGDFVVSDPRRALLSRQELMTKIADHGDGHGLGPAEKTSGKATYTFDAPGTPFRFLVIDTAHENGGAEGIIRQGDLDGVIKPALDTARAEGKYVILASHHAVTSLSDGGGFGGQKQADALTPEQWTAFLGQYDNVLFSMVGHSHQHRVRAVAPGVGHAYWEVMTAAIADYPHQFRVIELFDQDNGWIMMRATCVDLAVDGDPVAAEGRRRGIVDLTSGWLPVDAVTAEDRNVELWIRKP